MNRQLQRKVRKLLKALGGYITLHITEAGVMQIEYRHPEAYCGVQFTNVLGFIKWAEEILGDSND